MKRSHLSSDQLPGEHTGDMADISAFLLQHVNLGKCTLFLHLSDVSIMPITDNSEVEYGFSISKWIKLFYHIAFHNMSPYARQTEIFSMI